MKKNLSVILFILLVLALAASLFTNLRYFSTKNDYIANAWLIGYSTCRDHFSKKMEDPNSVSRDDIKKAYEEYTGLKW